MMTTDITDELREHPVALLFCGCVRCRAADEIESLRLALLEKRVPTH